MSGWIRTQNKVITKFTFSSLFHTAWLLAMTHANLMAGYKKAGVYPLNRHAIPVVNETDAIEQDQRNLSDYQGNLSNSLY
jgi:hypothetical protein